MATPHQMTRTGTVAQDAEEWACPECGRRLLLRKPPAFEKVVLEPGDEGTAHVGSSGLRMSMTAAPHADVDDLREQDRGWLAAHGIEWRPDDAL